MVPSLVLLPATVVKWNASPCMSVCRAALDKLSASVQARDGESKAAGGDEGGLLGSNTKTTELVPNPIYGSREVN